MSELLDILESDTSGVPFAISRGDDTLVALFGLGSKRDCRSLYQKLSVIRHNNKILCLIGSI